MIHILFVCLGNICRSPMAEHVFRHLVHTNGLAEKITTSSAGTGDWHIGEAIHPGTQAVLRLAQIPYAGSARQVSREELKFADYVVAMDQSNVQDLQLLDDANVLDGKLHRLLDFAQPDFPRDVPDPWYDNNFEYTYRLVDAGCRGLLASIRETHNL